VKAKWEPPDHDCLKINTDARFVEANNEGCTVWWSVMIRVSLSERKHVGLNMQPALW
jgi:hypothetical protein